MVTGRLALCIDHRESERMNDKIQPKICEMFSNKISAVVCFRLLPPGLFEAWLPRLCGGLVWQMSMHKP
jgi:hypothetical protein